MRPVSKEAEDVNREFRERRGYHEHRREEWGIVLEYLPSGKAGEARGEPIMQIVGESYFTLLEVVPKADAKLAVGTRIYIGQGEREAVDRVRRRISYDELTSSAQRELLDAVRKIVKSKEADFVNFVNRAGALNIRCHVLELLPSIGKKNLSAILEARDKMQFKSFADMHERVPHLGTPEDIFVERIMEELKGAGKYYLFIKAPPSVRGEFR